MHIGDCLSLDMLLYIKHYIDTTTGKCFSIGSFDKEKDSFVTDSPVCPFISRECFLHKLGCGAFLINARDYKSSYMETSLRTQIQVLAMDAVIGKIKPIQECYFPTNFV